MDSMTIKEKYSCINNMQNIDTYTKGKYPSLASFKKSLAENRVSGDYDKRIVIISNELSEQYTFVQSKIGRPARRPNNSQLEEIEKLMQKNPVMTIDELIDKTEFDHEAVRNVAEYLAREKGYELKRSKSHVLINTKAIENARAKK